ncbi:hypothetical protein Tco_0654676 [Tanacetum coccineum]|uniref:Uncharacterized protein n=1 Tax=Tanacetum coccineum TaxID=301880 RepID=A0ABQ4X449_9ASTR
MSSFPLAGFDTSESAKSSGYELSLVAGIATGALVKGGSRSEVPAQVEGEKCGGSSSGAGAAEESASKADAALSIQIKKSSALRKPLSKKGQLVIGPPKSATGESTVSSSHEATDCLCSLEAGSKQLVSKGSSKTSTFLAFASTRSEPLVSAWPEPRSAPVSHHISRIVFDPMEDSVKTPSTILQNFSATLHINLNVYATGTIFHESKWPLTTSGLITFFRQNELRLPQVSTFSITRSTNLKFNGLLPVEASDLCDLHAALRLLFL